MKLDGKQTQSRCRLSKESIKKIGYSKILLFQIELPDVTTEVRIVDPCQNVTVSLKGKFEFSYPKLF